MRDFAFGVVMLVVAGVFYALAGAIPESVLADAVGPAGLPRAYAITLAALSLLLIGRVVIGRLVRPSLPAASTAPRAAWRPPWRALGTLAIGVAYLLVVPWLGYPLSLAALIAATTASQGGRFTPRVAVIALSGAAVLWLLFVWLLNIRHPPGVWPSLL